MRGAESLPSFGLVPGLAGAFASVFSALARFPVPGGAFAGNAIHILIQMPLRASSRINVAKTAKAPLDMTAAVVEATPHSPWRTFI
jgi:uncharacterized membrane protein